VNSSTFAGHSTSKTNIGGKERADVSFLKEKSTVIFSTNAAKKVAVDGQQAVLMSQSQLTSGNEGRDDYLQVALGLRKIGKSIMDMPSSLEDLRMLSREYMKNLGVTDDLKDEQVYLQYIEEHLKFQEKLATPIESNKVTFHASPIRNLADFYSHKLNKLQRHADSSFISSKPNTQRGKQQVVLDNLTLVDIDQMTVLDIEKLEKSPPKIQPRRKNMKVINNKAMTQFGPEAFQLDIDTQVAPSRLSVPRKQSPADLI